MLRPYFRTLLIPLLLLVTSVGCDQQNPVQKEPRESRLEKISSSHRLAKEFFSELSSSNRLRPELVARGNLKRLTVARKDGGTIKAVAAPLRRRGVAKISPIRTGKNSSATTHKISKSRVLYIPAIGEFYRLDQHFTDSANKTGHIRFKKFGTEGSVTMKLEGGTVIRTMRRTPGSVSAKDMTTGECLDAAAEGCGSDGECFILCALTSPWCEAAIVVSCAIAANN